MTFTSRTLRKAAVRLPLAALAVVVVAGCTASTAGAGVGDHRAAATAHGVPVSDWTTFDQNGLRTGVDASGATFTNPTRAWTSPTLDGSLYGQPLIYANRVFAATENDTVYGLAANTGAVLWKAHLATPFDPTTVQNMCGNISPTVGITGTPVIDPARSEIFVVATEQVPGGASHHLVGLNLYTGAVVLDVAIDPAAIANPAFELQRVSLALTAGRVIVGMGGNAGDCGDYHGLVISVPEGGGSAPSTFTVADQPNDNQGAVWMGGAAPVIDARGNVWVSSGNALTGSTPDDSDSVLELSPTMTLLDSFTPSTWKNDNNNDQDLGSAAPVLLPNGLVFQVGKLRTAYVLDQSALGGIGGQLNQTTGFCPGNVPDGGAAQVNGTVYVPCSNGLAAVTPTRSNSAPSWITTTGAHSSPIVAGGKIWSFGGGTLYELNTDGTRYKSLNVGTPTTHFPSPAAADDLVVAPSSDTLVAFAGDAGVPGPPTPAPTSPGYWLVASDGGIFSFGASGYYGSTGNIVLNRPIVGMAATPDRRGYWLVASDGGVFAFGDAGFYGSTGALHLNEPMVGIAPTASGHGYWLVASDGGVFAFGDAGFYGSMGGTHLNQPVVGIAAPHAGGGYWLVASDGGIFAFGSAPFAGSAGNIPLARPIVGMAVPGTSGDGYWLVASDGGIFNYGGAGFYGSTGGQSLGTSVVGMASTTSGHGYWLASANGGVYALGDAVFSGALAGLPLNKPVVGIAAGPSPA